MLTRCKNLFLSSLVDVVEVSSDVLVIKEDVLQVLHVVRVSAGHDESVHKNTTRSNITAIINARLMMTMMMMNECALSWREVLKPCPHCRRKVRLSQKTATVAEFGDSRRFLR